MSLSYPLTWPADIVPSRIVIAAQSVVGVDESPFTLQQQVYAHQGQRLEMQVELPPLERDDAENAIGILLALNGREGTLVMSPDPANPNVRGTWAGSPKVVGPLAAGVTSIPMDGFTGGATVKAGDWFQYSSGSATEIHKVVQSGTADGGGLLTLEVWPRMRATLADNATFTIVSPVGLWRLAENRQSWSLEVARVYGLSFSLVEAL